MPVTSSVARTIVRRASDAQKPHRQPWPGHPPQRVAGETWKARTGRFTTAALGSPSDHCVREDRSRSSSLRDLRASAVRDHRYSALNGRVLGERRRHAEHLRAAREAHRGSRLRRHHRRFAEPLRRLLHRPGHGRRRDRTHQARHGRHQPVHAARGSDGVRHRDGPRGFRRARVARHRSGDSALAHLGYAPASPAVLDAICASSRATSTARRCRSTPTGRSTRSASRTSPRVPDRVAAPGRYPKITVDVAALA